MGENILVCVGYYKNAEKLIKKGARLATALNGVCQVLTVNPMLDNNDFEKITELETIEMVASKYNVPFLFQPLEGRKISDVIAEVVKSNQINQVILGQPVQSRWDMLVKGSLVSELFSRLENVDVTIVEVHAKNVTAESEYEKGMPAYVVKEGRHYFLSLENPTDYEMEGFFFQSTKTEFQTGIFRTVNDREAVLLKVSDGVVKWPSELQTS
ncbi:two-component system, OmpR family, sensor histidine kinase KdpD [Evansella caseinilytica]|uniref:Two-component system, OmpR family, sensor histidine kinase KdpD n=1 Tax=Evansella caseinilytica TaxID=1503961 RepID=A0A1H3HCJ0_9BACI|nr:hypothetical protein [Evansella caseinilytica]SDY13060.1 two-component system, OmpR family, sensor histidine kinase KdpD [Evansella caseinilytica]